MQEQEQEQEQENEILQTVDIAGIFPPPEPLDWQIKTGLNPDSLCGAIEALIFMTDKPVPLTKLKGQIDPDIPLSVLHECLTRLQEEYEKSHHGIRLLEVAQGYQFRTKPFYAKYIQNLLKVSSLTLSPIALEVLAIIAYKQPVARGDIEKIRGVDSSHIIRALMDKRLVTVIGRSDDLGKPVMYGTTQEFLEVFSLKDLKDLPPEYEIESMAASTSVGELSDFKALFRDSTENRYQWDELDELDELSKSIKSISAETLLTKELKVEDQKEGEVPKKSAFDLLEILLDQREVAEENRKALEAPSLDAINDGFWELPKVSIPLPAPLDPVPSDSGTESEDLSPPESLPFVAAWEATTDEEEWEVVEEEVQENDFIEEIIELNEVDPS